MERPWRGGQAENGQQFPPLWAEAGSSVVRWLAGWLASPGQSWVQGQINKNCQDMTESKGVGIQPGTK